MKHMTTLVLFLCLASGCGSGAIGSLPQEIDRTAEHCGYTLLYAGDRVFATGPIPGAEIETRYSPQRTRPGIAEPIGDGLYRLSEGWYGSDECAFMVL